MASSAVQFYTGSASAALDASEVSQGTISYYFGDVTSVPSGDESVLIPAEHLAAFLESLQAGRPRPVLDPTPLAEVVAALQRLATLKQNWDSYGSEAPSENSISIAQALVRSVYERIGAPENLRTLPVVVAPLSDAGVQLQWKGNAAEIELEIGPDGALNYLVTRVKEGQREFEERDGVSEGDIVNIVSEIVS